MWSIFANTPVAGCSPPLVWYGSANASVKCGLLLALRLLLEIGGASMPGLMAVFLCAVAAPAQKPAAACAAAIGACALGLLYFLANAFSRGTMKLAVWADLAALSASPWLTVWLIFHLEGQRRRLPGPV